MAQPASRSSTTNKTKASNGKMKAERAKALFMERRRETTARNKAGTAGISPDEVGKSTPKKTRKYATNSVSLKKEDQLRAKRAQAHNTVPSGRGISGGEVFTTGTAISATGKRSAARPKPDKKSEGAL